MKHTSYKDAEKNMLCQVLAVSLRPYFLYTSLDFSKLQEIRLRVNQPLLIRHNNKEMLLGVNGQVTNVLSEALIVNASQIRETLEYICDYSIYAYEDEIRHGYITIPGGHRVGLSGKVVLEHGKVESIKHISFLNIRLAHSVMGCANKIMEYIKNESSIYNSLVIAPPGCGKTTLLRDMIRYVSDECRMTVAVVDERSEIAACYLGVPQNNVGMRTDVLDACPKDQGMIMMIRSMAPMVIAVDELGGTRDIEAMHYAMNSGCKVIATIHGSDYKDVLQRENFKEIICQKYFQRYVVLGPDFKTGNVGAVLDAGGNCLFCG